MKSGGLPDTEANRQEYLETLIDYYAANYLTPPEVENYINLARKKDYAQTLSMVVNRDQATSMEIYRALREFCDIPKGEVFISPSEQKGFGSPCFHGLSPANFPLSVSPRTTS